MNTIIRKSIHTVGQVLKDPLGMLGLSKSVQQAWTPGGKGWRRKDRLMERCIEMVLQGASAVLHHVRLCGFQIRERIADLNVKHSLGQTFRLKGVAQW